MIPRRTLLATGALAFATLAMPAAADWPSRDMTFIVPYGTGGSTDPISRAFVRELTEILDRNINVENRPGGSATIGTGTILRAEPDGHTIGLSSNSALMFQPLVRDNLGWESDVEDFDTIVKLVDIPAVLYVSTDSDFHTLDDVLEFVEANPDSFRVSVSGLLTAPDLVVQHFNSLSGLAIRTVPFSGGGGEALAAVLSGRVEGSVGYGPSIKGHVDAGTIRPIAVFQNRVYADFPDATPITETGHAALLPAAYYVIAPNGIPDDVRERLVEASHEAIRRPRFIEFAEANAYNYDPLDTAAAEAELTEFGNIFRNILEFVGQ